MKLKTFLVAAMAAMVSLGANAQLTDGTVYWIQDTGTGQFISMGASWGTQAAVKDVSGLGMEAVYVSDGVYKLRNIQLNKVHNKTKGLGSNLYMDNDSPAEWTLTASGNGYTIKNGTKYLCNNGSVNSLGTKPLGSTEDAAAATVWRFLTKTEYAAAIQAYKDAQAASVAASAGYSLSTVSALETLISDANQFISKDYTNSITNPTIGSDWTGWTHAVAPGSNRSEGAGVGSGCAEFWNGVGYATQTVSNLPNGLYKVTFAGTYRPGNSQPAENVGAENTSSPAFGYANNDKVELVHWIDVAAKANNRAAIVSNKAAYTNTIYTYVTDGTLKLGITQDAHNGDNNYQWCPFGQFTLTYYSDQVSDEEAAALIASVPTGKMSDAAQTALNAAKTAFEANKTIANYNALNAAVAAANISVAEYATIASGVIPTNVLNGWSKTTTAETFHINTWSTEGDTDGSGMTTPFVENWIASGGQLGAGRVQYTFTDLNPDETYVVTARVRVFNEAATGVTGASFFAGDNSKSLETFGAACVGDFATKGKFAVLSCAGTVDANGQLQFGVELAEGSPINWIAIKDVTITEGTGDVPTAIGLNKTSVSLTTGSNDVLTATITPATADDKTIIWSSTDASVVSVSGGNIVALKAGTATITATAYAGDNVTASCTVTVADAAAPSFYSETIAAGDYYIMNAATGTFLGGGNSWGTQASIIEHGIPFGVAVGEGVYTLDSYTYNNATAHFLNGTYVDGASTNLYITSLGDGKFSISTADGSDFVTAIAGSTVVSNTAANTESSLAQWYFLSKADRDKMLQSATAENPVDATYYIKQANISRNRSAGAYNKNAWDPYTNAGGNNDNFNFYKANAAVNVWQTIEGIPNGTYTLKMQGCTTGSAVLWANESSVDILANDGDITNQATASTAFSAGKYVNTVDVTVTNRTLSITVKSDDEDKVTTFDNFELYLKSYTPVTAIAAKLDKDEIQIGQTATITTTSTPAAASFNAPTSYSSSDESIATVDENGVVTGVGVGTATITVHADEMENNSTTVDITVTLVTPTAFELSETEVALNKETTSATLTINPTPDGANTSATWKSTDETVATVVNGVVTAVSTGTATIIATSTIDENIEASATVTVTFDESEVPATTYVNNGATRTVYTLGENLIKNGSFEYPNAVFGWTTGTGSVNAMSTSNFNVPTTGAAVGDQYLQAKESKGGADAKSINTSWPLEDGKTYVFGYKIKANKQCTTDLGYIGTSLSNTKGSENANKKFETPAYGTDWQDVTYTFTNTDNYKYLVFNARWMANAQSFDNFYLCEAEYTLEGNVDYATAAIPTANIGAGAFQYSQDAIDAANALVQGTATIEDVENAYAALTTINEPADGQLFNVVLTYSGWTYDQKAMTYIANGRNDGGFYNIQYKEAANQNLAQAFTFTKVDGNNYKMSQIDADGNVRYISTGVPYSGNTSQIRTVTDAENALVVTVIPTATEGKWNLRNTAANQYIGSQDAGVYTVNSHIDFNIVETAKPSIAINTTAAGWGTVILPFAAEIPEGVKAYSVSETSGNVLTLVEAEALEANKPYIIEGAWNETVEGDAQGTALTYTDGLLTGTYAQMAAPNESYILQKHDDVVGFYQVNTAEAQPNVPANRAYLTVPAAGNIKAFFFGGDADAIKSVFDSAAKGDIFDLSGRKVEKMQKGGIYVINGKKVMVK